MNEGNQRQTWSGQISWTFYREYIECNMLLNLSGGVLRTDTGSQRTSPLFFEDRCLSDGKMILKLDYEMMSIFKSTCKVQLIPLPFHTL